MPKSENTVQDGCRLLIQSTGGILLRNNSGAMKLADGRFLRWGLGNDSHKSNEVRKTSDLIGVTPMLIQPWHVGRVIGVATSIECKHEGWVYSPNNAHEVAQMRGLEVFTSRGGIGAFISDEHQLVNLVEKFIL